MELPYNQMTRLYQLWLKQQLDKSREAYEKIDTMTRNTYATNKLQLRPILCAIKDTVVGQAYRLGEILDLSDENDDRLLSMFSANIPVSNYDAIKSYVDRMIDGAESNLLMEPDTVALYTKTTGTTSTPKRFPIHKRSLIFSDLQYTAQWYATYQQFPKLFEIGSKTLFLYSKPDLKVAADGTFIGCISMLSYMSMRDHVNYLAQLHETQGSVFSAIHDHPPIWHYSSPPAAYEIKEKGYLETYYIHILFAIKNHENLCSITSIYITDMLLFFDILQKNWPEIVHDIRTACPDTVNSSFWSTIPEKLRDELIDDLQPPDPNLARFVETVMNHDELLPGWGKRLFSSLLMTRSRSGSTMEHYQMKLSAILGDDVACLGDDYSASEAFLGVNKCWTDTNRFHHAVWNAYVELLPEEQWFVDQPRCISIDSAEIGERTQLATYSLLSHKTLIM